MMPKNRLIALARSHSICVSVEQDTVWLLLLMVRPASKAPSHPPWWRSTRIPLTRLGLGFLASRPGVRQDGARALGEEDLLFGRKPDRAADPPADIPGGERGEAHRLPPQGDENAAGPLNRLLALPNGDRGWSKRNEGALVLGNDGACLLGERFLAGARQLDRSADPVRPLGAECAGGCAPAPPESSAGGCRRRSQSPAGTRRWRCSVSSFLRGVTPWRLVLRAKPAAPAGQRMSRARGSPRPAAVA